MYIHVKKFRIPQSQDMGNLDGSVKDGPGQYTLGYWRASPKAKVWIYRNRTPAPDLAMFSIFVLCVCC